MKLLVNPYSAKITAENVNPIENIIESFLAKLSHFGHSRFCHSIF
jgi:hypothetical protein